MTDDQAACMKLAATAATCVLKGHPIEEIAERLLDLSHKRDWHSALGALLTVTGILAIADSELCADFVIACVNEQKIREDVQ